MEFFVGTFNTPQIFRCRFVPPSSSSQTVGTETLQVTHVSPAIGSHSWLALSPTKSHLYATAWTTPPSIAAYLVTPSGPLKLLNNRSVATTPGYVAASQSHVYSCGGPSGEVFSLTSDGSLGDVVQSLNFVDESENTSAKRGTVAHGDFGGLRHGSHSIDLSPDGQTCFVADIGRNCIWTYHVATDGQLDLVEKHISPRKGDGPRHAWPHPNGKVLYVVQEHSSMIDVFERVGEHGATLKHVQGAKILPEGMDPKLFWADEVRTSRPPTSGTPKYLYASNRGLNSSTMGYVAVFRLGANGYIEGEALDMYQTPTSGGIANAVEPAPMQSDDQAVEYMALTDSQEGWLFILSFDGSKIAEVSRIKLQADDGSIAKAATAVWR